MWHQLTCWYVLLSPSVVAATAAAATLRVLTAATGKWNLSMLESSPRLAPNVSITELHRLQRVEDLHKGCFNNADLSHHGTNRWIPELYVSGNDPNYLNGTTFYINEHMHVGHVFYDISIIQVMFSTKIDRIVLQRAPCMNANLCTGVGTFDGFYKGLYMALIEAHNPGIPVFVRWSHQEKRLAPIHLSSKTKDGYNGNELVGLPMAKEIPLKHIVCFERVIRRYCPPCFRNSLSAAAVQRFKSEAYAIVRSRPQHIGKQNFLPLHFVEGDPVVVTFSYRGPTATRRIENIDFVLNQFNAAFSRAPESSSKVIFRAVNSSDPNRLYDEQIQMVAESHVIITEHGSFQGNLIYMRNGSLLIDLRGGYDHAEYENFEIAARMFGVFYDHVVTSGLTSHWDHTFNITKTEIDKVVDIIKTYIADVPYQFNAKPKLVRL